MMITVDFPLGWDRSLLRMRMRLGGHIVRATASFALRETMADRNVGFLDRLSTTGWEGQSLVVTLARTSSPTQPIAGPTKSPPCIIQPNYIAGYSTPSRMAQNIAMPPSPIATE